MKLLQRSVAKRKYIVRALAFLMTLTICFDFRHYRINCHSLKSSCRATDVPVLYSTSAIVHDYRSSDFCCSIRFGRKLIANEIYFARTFIFIISQNFHCSEDGG